MQRGGRKRAVLEPDEHPASRTSVDTGARTYRRSSRDVAGSDWPTARSRGGTRSTATTSRADGYVSDRTADGRRLRSLTIVDQYTQGAWR